MPVRFRPIVLLLLAALALPAAAQTLVRTVTLPGARDLIVDETRDRLLVGVGETYTADDGLVALDPVAGAVTDRLFVEGGAARLALSADGATLYAGLATAPFAARFALDPWEEVGRFQLGIDDVLGARYANDLAVDPADPDVLVVALRARTARPSDLGAAVFVDGVERPKAYDRAAVVEVGADGALFAYDAPPEDPGIDPSGDDYTLSRLTVTADGLDGEPLMLEADPGLPRDNLLFGPAGEFVAVGDRLYGSAGSVADVAAGRLLARFTPSYQIQTVGLLAVRPLPDLGRVAFLAGGEAGLFLAVFDDATFNLLGYVAVDAALPVSDSDQTPRRLVRWSDRGLAYVSAEGVVLIESDLLADEIAFAAVADSRVDVGMIRGVARRPVVLRNLGTAALTVESVASTAPEVSFEPASFTLAPGEVLEGEVVVTPSSRDIVDIEAALTFVGNGAQTPPLTVTATTRVPYVFFEDDALDLGAVAIGEERQVEVLLTNAPAGPVRVTALRSTDPRFVVVPTANTTPPFTMDPRNSRFVRVAFRPDAEGPVEASLIVESDGYFPTDSIDLTGEGTMATAADDGAAAETALGAPYPNPARADARLRVSLAAPGPVRVTLHDVLGRTVAVLLDGDVGAGTQTLRLPLGDLPVGTYVVRMQAPDADLVRRVAVVR